MMPQVSFPHSDTVRNFVYPRYMSWLFANVALYTIIVGQYEEVVVEPGQGGRVEVFVWPMYWTSYQIQDIAFPAVPEYTWPSLLLNYALGVIPLYIVTNVGLSVIEPADDQTWEPSLSAYGWGGIFLFLVLTFIPAHLYGMLGITLWVILTSSSLVTFSASTIHGIRHTE